MTNLSITPPDTAGSDGRPSRGKPRRPPAPRPDAAPGYDPDQRLMIQEVEDTGRFVYTVIDRASGAVVAQTPREEVSRMGERADYAAGGLIRATA